MGIFEINFSGFGTPQAVFNEAARLAKNKGFQYLLYAMTRQTVNGVQETVLSSYPKAWMPHYMAQGYRDCDPVLKHMMTSNCHAVWTPEFFDANFKSRLMYREASDVGIREGITIPVHGADGAIACVNFSSDRLEKNLSCTTMGELYIIANFMHDAIIKLCKNSPGEVIRLTPREIEALKWTMQGLTSAGVGEKLGIGTRTAQEHLENVIKKLGAVNKIHAVAKAVSLKLI